MSNKQKIECKLSVEKVEENGIFFGYAAVFDILDFQGDIIKMGAISKTKNNLQNIKILWQHDYKKPIGTVKYIEEDNYGLYIKGQLLTELQSAYEAYVMLKHGIINGLSIGYNIVSFHIEKDARIIEEIELLEISLVTFPANEFAKVIHVKNQDEEAKKRTNFLLGTATRTIRSMKQKITKI